MKIIVEPGRCEGHAICVGVLPEVFALDDDDEQVRLLVEEPEESSRAIVANAVRECPMAALRLAD